GSISAAKELKPIEIVFVSLALLADNNISDPLRTACFVSKLLVFTHIVRIQAIPCTITTLVTSSQNGQASGNAAKAARDRLKTEFTAAKEKNPLDPRFAQFQAEYEQNIFLFVDECDRRIKAAHRRLEKTPEENAKTTNLMKEIGELELAIQGGTEKIEQLGEQGLVEESMNELRAVEALKVEKGDKERELQNLTETSGASGHQKLRVCDVCGAYLSVLDSDRRLADHFGGKMHLGYHELRRMLQVFKEEKEKRRNAPPVDHRPRLLQRQGCLVPQLDLLAQEGMVPGVTEIETTAHPETTTIEVIITVVNIVTEVIGIGIDTDQVGAMMTGDAIGPGRLRVRSAESSQLALWFGLHDDALTGA
ncbi:7698_t:CDS:10, partial [Acaulospora colombiana]